MHVVTAIARARRVRALAGPLVAVCVAACGGPSTQVQEDIASLRDEVAATRRSQDELRSRIDRLEARAEMHPAPAANGSASPGDPLKALPVVHLEPDPSDPAQAPDVDTSIPIHDRRDILLDHSVRDSDAPVDMNALIARENRRSPAQPPPDDAPPSVPQQDSQFQQAVVLYNEARYADASAAFKAFAENFPSHKAASDALFLAGMSETASSHCLDAEPLFESVVKLYPDSDAAVRSLLAYGRCESAIGHDETARSYFKRVLREYPHTAEASQAKEALADLASPK